MSWPARRPKKIVEFFYDVLSPYSWIAFEALTNYTKGMYRPEWKSVDVQLRPVFLPAIMKATGSRPPGLASVLPARAKYEMVDLVNLSQYHQVPFRMPTNITKIQVEKGTAAAQHLLTGVELHCPEYLEPLTRELFLRMWYKDADVTTEDSLRTACECAGLTSSETTSLIVDTFDRNFTRKLQDNTQEALYHGAFDVPTYVVRRGDELNSKQKGKMIFGCDRLFLVAYYLNVEMPTAAFNCNP